MTKYPTSGTVTDKRRWLQESATGDESLLRRVYAASDRAQDRQKPSDDIGVECHQAVGEIEHEIGNLPGVTYHHWDEDKDDKVYRLLRPSKYPKVSDSRAHDVLHDMDNGTANGHSFIQVGHTFVDPHMRSRGIPQHDIDAVDSHILHLKSQKDPLDE